MAKILIPILSIILAAMSTVCPNMALLGYEDSAPRMFSGWTTCGEMRLFSRAPCDNWMLPGVKM